MTKHKKFDKHKENLSLFPMKSIRPCTQAWEHGSKKYGKNNWKLNDIEWDRTFASILRHLTECQDDPTAVDPESNAMHLAHAATQILMKLHFIEEGNYYELDDKDE